MKTWQSILIAGAMIAASIIVRVEPIAAVHAQSTDTAHSQAPETKMSKGESKCILDNARDVASERMAVFVFQACKKLFI